MSTARRARRRAATRLFGRGADDGARRPGAAAAAAVRRRFAVVAGGPGTGKTTTVARIVALLAEQAAARGDAPPLVALAAPTGKAAARLEEAVHEEARQARRRARRSATALLALEASTLHRLLGWRPGSHSRFRHHRGNRLPHDVVIVDETSMVSLSLMARLVEAVRPDARLVLVGDPGQLTSIEAGAVLGDIVGPAATAAIGGIVVLDRVHRYGGGDRRARRGGPRAATPTRRSPRCARRGDGRDAGSTATPPSAAPTRSAPSATARVAAGRAVLDAARAGDAEQALAALGAFRLLCAHRRGPHGVATWMHRRRGLARGRGPGVRRGRRSGTPAARCS